MNLHEIRKEFDRIIRSQNISDFDEYRDTWINQAWQRISEIFVIPSLTKTTLVDSVADQQDYLLPYDYNGTEIGIVHDNLRLDPVMEESLRLRYESREGNMGRVRYYDVTGIIGEDLLLVEDCALTNGSKVVETTSINPILDVGHWVRFDPLLATTTTDGADEEGYLDPGDFGYQIDAGEQVSGTSFTLTQEYRGPSGSGFTVRVQPSEQAVFRVYGVPISAVTNAFDVRYSARPRRLYSAHHVPEWPNMGLPIAYMAVSRAHDWHNFTEAANRYFGLALAQVQGLQRRNDRKKKLVSDLSVGSTSGRKTGMRGIHLGRRR